MQPVDLGGVQHGCHSNLMDFTVTNVGPLTSTVNLSHLITYHRACSGYDSHRELQEDSQPGGRLVIVSIPWLWIATVNSPQSGIGYNPLTLPAVSFLSVHLGQALLICQE